MMRIAHNFSSERKHTMKTILTAISLALTFVSPTFAGIEWNFPSDTTSVGASVGSGTAMIHLSPYNTGWHDGTTLPWNLGSAPNASGLWDLGRAGSIVLGSLSGSGLTTLNVFQWVNSGTYNGDLTIRVNNNALGGSPRTAQIGLLGADGGAWYDYTYNLGAALGSLDTVTITAGSGGAIIDRLTLVPEPSSMIAGAVLLIPFALSTLPILRRKRTS